MAYEEMKCRKCGKPIQFAEGAPWIRCVYCGAEYTRTAKKEKAGEVQPIGNGGNPLFEYIVSSCAYKQFTSKHMNKQQIYIHRCSIIFQFKTTFFTFNNIIFNRLTHD